MKYQRTLKKGKNYDKTHIDILKILTFGLIKKNNSSRSIRKAQFGVKSKRY